MSNLFVQPEHGAGHSDVSKTDSLSHQEGAGVQVLVQYCKGPLHILLGLLCSLERPTEKNDYSGIYNILYIPYYIMKYRVLYSGQLKRASTFYHSYLIIL